MYDDVTADAQGTAAGISRRDMLKRSAVVGGAGALMWAAPSITKFGGAAFGTEGTPLDLVSWVIVWFDCDGQRIRVKYESQDDGTYAIDPSGKPSQNEGCPELFADAESAYGPSTVGDSNPSGVTVGTGAKGELQITTTSCTIVGWVLHDGSCGHPKEGTSNCRSSVTGDTTVGPAVPTTTGTFEWTKCSD